MCRSRCTSPSVGNHAGSASALRHLHKRQDEFVFVLEGELTLIGDALKGTVAVVIAGTYGGPNAAMLAALETADVALMTDDLDRLLGRRVMERDALGVEPEHFREYRLRVITTKLEAMPDLIDRLYKRLGA